MHDYTALELTPRLEAILNYATLLARDPSVVQEEDVQVLRRAGLSDEEILSVVLITCTYSFMTRLAEGLGVELDERTHEAAAQFVQAHGEGDRLEWLHAGKATRGAELSLGPDGPQR